MAVRRVELHHLLGERTVDRVDHWGVDPIGHGEGGEPGMVVNDIERGAVLSGGVNLGECAGDVIGLEAGGSDPVRAGLREEGSHLCRRVGPRCGKQSDEVSAAGQLVGK